jgi:glycosyltransferase involved in cell wall biosynthesis
MKVLFICGSAQPQRCGVGDYSRRLAGELIRQGHEACIISLMDAEILSAVVEMQMDVNTSVTVFRMPYSNGYIRNCREAKSFVDNFSPDWISLQYVPFSFHPKGLPVGLARHLKLLAGTRHLHIMFHELWVGINGFVNLKLKVWGRIQLELILSLVKHLNPDIVHTQTELYQTMLSKHGINTRLLPLFSNIPSEADQLNNNEYKSVYRSKESFALVLFGSIHKNAPIQQFAAELKSYSDKRCKSIKLIILGRSGKEADRWTYEFQKLNIEVHVTGEQAYGDVSRILREADFGITTSAFDIIEKSGSVAAMVEHGLNVICVPTRFSKNQITNSRQIKELFNYSTGNLESFFDSKPDLSSKPFFCSLKETSSKLIESFNDSAMIK